MNNFPRSKILENEVTRRELASSKNRERVEIGIKNRRMTCPEAPKRLLSNRFLIKKYLTILGQSGLCGKRRSRQGGGDRGKVF